MNAAELSHALKKAHVQHLCERLQNRDYWSRHLSTGLAAFDTRPVAERIEIESLIPLIDDWLGDVNTAQGLEPIIRQAGEAMLHAASNRHEMLAELLDEAHLKAALAPLLRLQSLRERTIHATLDHPLVSEMVSEMLYTGIKNFLLEENALARLPGISNMMRLGRQRIGKAMGGLEGNLRWYLRHNTRIALQAGENWLNQYLTDQHIDRLIDDTYARMAGLTPAEIIATIPDGTVGEVTPSLAALTDRVGQRDYTRGLIAVGLRAAMQSLSERTLRDLFSAQGTSPEARIRMLAPALAEQATTLDQQGLLACWAEQLLGDFYDSPSCLALLEKALQ